MDLRAIQPVYREGRLIQPGESFTTTAEDGQALIRGGKARAPNNKKAAAKPTKPEPQEEK
ncbi:hypothetical protein [Pseudomonas nitroreducens]|uniref:hypothetical protein n=1 Tax=Pseudomonas nitroreducens TaxID=46680 RepID=UPI002D806732|nr:hypothetical protein [Pseudomonas nitroreducens]